MDIVEEFDEWAKVGRDQGMETRHWHTAKHAIAAMPIEPGDGVLDLGTGSGYALRAISERRPIAYGIGVDASGQMLRNAASYTEDASLHFVQAPFESLPIADDTIDHVFSMEAFYYAKEPHTALSELHRVLKPGGTVHCAVNFFDESEHTHEWQDSIPVEMTLWDRAQYRAAFRAAGFAVATQRCIPDMETAIPPEEEFPTDTWESRDAMVDRYRRWGTLLTVGVACLHEP